MVEAEVQGQGTLLEELKLREFYKEYFEKRHFSEKEIERQIKLQIFKDHDTFGRLSKNTKIWIKEDSKITTLTFWKNTMFCECLGCRRKTHLSSESVVVGLHHFFCKKHYEEIHAYHVVTAEENKKTTRKFWRNFWERVRHG